MAEKSAASKRGFNLPLPFGWFAIARSEELQNGEVKPLQVCGEELVLWRGEDGRARAVDAICPHLGAHLGHGGTVAGNDIRCPFHHWQYRGDGSVSAIPYAQEIPDSFRQPCERGWPLLESMGVIFAWWHPHDVAPLFEIEPVEEIAAQGWIAAHYEEWTLDVHIQEITENSSDTAHFQALHGVASPPVPEMKVDGYFRYSSVTSKLPTAKGEVEGKIDVRAPGPGVSFTRFWGITEMLLLQMQTPLDQEKTMLRHLYFHPKDLDPAKVNVTKKLIANTTRQLEEDAKIWPYKHHLEHPMLVKGDGPIMVYRRFYARFYADAQESE